MIYVDQGVVGKHLQEQRLSLMGHVCRAAIFNEARVRVGVLDHISTFLLLQATSLSGLH